MWRHRAVWLVVAGLAATGATCGGSTDATSDAAQDAGKNDGPNLGPLDARDAAMDGVDDAVDADTSTDAAMDADATPADSNDAPFDASAETTDSTDGTVDATDGADECAFTCTLGDMRCTADLKQTESCSMTASGCYAWIVTCPYRCFGGGGGATIPCECPAEPAECLGLSKTPAAVCKDSLTVVICDAEADGCTFEKPSATCTGVKTCQGAPGSAACKCPPPGDGTAGTGCTDVEAASPDPKVNTRCDPASGRVTRCTAVGTGADLCRVWVADPACPMGQACTTAGSTAPHCAMK